MSQGNAYNELGQILSKGAEIAVGLAIATGKTPAEVYLMINSRWPQLSKPEQDELYIIGQAGARSGQDMNDAISSGNFDIESIPVQPSLFGSSAAGRRLAIVAFATSATTGETSLVRFYAPDFSSLDRLFQEIGSYIAQTAQACPGFANRVAEDGGDLNGLQILFAERRF